MQIVIFKTAKINGLYNLRIIIVLQRYMKNTKKLKLINLI